MDKTALEILLKVDIHKRGWKSRGATLDGVDRTMTEAESEFVLAMDAYRKINGRRFPSWTESLRVLLALGYRKTAKPVPIKELPEC